MTRRRWLVSLAVVVLVGYYAASSLRLMNGPGFSPDEMLFVNAARTGKDYAYCERWHGIPILVMPYIGALKSYLYYPIFIPFRVSIASVRVPVIAITCVSLVLAYVLTRRFFDVGRSLLVLGLLCTDPNLILMTTFDWGPVVLMTLLKVLALWLFFRVVEQESIRPLLALMLVLLLGVFDKLNFLWFVFAMVLGAAVVYRGTFARMYQARRGWFLVLLAGFTVFVGLACSRAVHLASEFNMRGLASLVNGLDAHLAWLAKGIGRWLSGTGAYLVMTTRPSARSHSELLVLPALCSAVVFWPPFRRRWDRDQVRVVTFLWILVVAILGQMAITQVAGALHHLMILWLVPQLLAVHGLVFLGDGLARLKLRALTAVLYAGVIAIALNQARVAQSYWWEGQKRPMFEDRWDPQVSELASYLNAQLESVDRVVFVDYGPGCQVRALTPELLRAKLNDECFFLDDHPLDSASGEFFYDRYCWGDRTLVVFASLGPLVSQSRDRFVELIRMHGRNLVPLKRWNRPNGQMLYSVSLLR